MEYKILLHCPMNKKNIPDLIKLNAKQPVWIISKGVLALSHRSGVRDRVWVTAGILRDRWFRDRFFQARVCYVGVWSHFGHTPRFDCGFAQVRSHSPRSVLPSSSLPLVPLPMLIVDDKNTFWKIYFRKLNSLNLFFRWRDWTTN